jgi:hypothetical protein
MKVVKLEKLTEIKGGIFFPLAYQAHIAKACEKNPPS